MLWIIAQIWVYVLPWFVTIVSFLYVVYSILLQTLVSLCSLFQTLVQGPVLGYGDSLLLHEQSLPYHHRTAHLQVDLDSETL